MRSRKKVKARGGAVAVLLSTCPPQAAERLARFLVEKRYAACVNVVPRVRSLYRWQGKLQREAESLLVVKCAREQAQEATRALVGEHPYTLPEVVCLEVTGGSSAYLSWVVENSRPPARGRRSRAARARP